MQCNCWYSMRPPPTKKKLKKKNHPVPSLSPASLFLQSSLISVLKEKEEKTPVLINLHYFFFKGPSLSLSLYLYICCRVCLSLSAFFLSIYFSLLNSNRERKERVRGEKVQDGMGWDEKIMMREKSFAFILSPSFIMGGRERARER